jgi:hypothetical protein
MSEITPRPIENFILNGVQGNFTIALKVSTFHMDALNANADSDPAVLALRDRYKPYHEELEGAGAQKKVAKGDRADDTDSKDTLLDALVSVHMPAWKQTAGNVSGYGPTTDAFSNLFGKVEIYSRGKQSQRLENVRVLRDKCLAVAGLAALGATIGTFFDALKASMTTQGEAKATVTTDIGDHKAAVDVMCDYQFSDYGMIVYLYSNNPEKIRSFFDFETLRKHVSGDLIMGLVHGDKTKTIGTKKFNIDSKMKVTLTEDGIIWVINSAKNIVKPTGVLIRANTPTIVTFPDAGDFNNRVIQIKNLNPSTAATWEVEFL